MTLIFDTPCDDITEPADLIACRSGEVENNSGIGQQVGTDDLQAAVAIWITAGHQNCS
jgi:hypothetical protein